MAASSPNYKEYFGKIISYFNWIGKAPCRLPHGKRLLFDDAGPETEDFQKVRQGHSSVFNIF